MVGICKEANLTVKSDAVRNWLNHGSSLHQKHIIKLEEYIIKNFDYFPEINFDKVYSEILEFMDKSTNLYNHNLSLLSIEDLKMLEDAE